MGFAMAGGIGSLVADALDQTPVDRSQHVSAGLEAQSALDLFISVRGDSGWRPPRPLSIINTVVDYELTPTLSRDGEYLYVEVAGAILRWRVEELLTDDERRLVRQPNANRVPR